MFKEVFELNPYPVFSFTQEGKILECNDAAKDLLEAWNEGVESLNEKNLRVLIFKNTLGLQNVEILAGERYFTFDVISASDDHLVFYGADVTYQKNNAETLFSMIDDIYEGMLLVDTENEGQIVEVNYTLSKILGYQREEILSLKLGDLVSDFRTFDPEKWKSHIKTIKSQKKGEVTTFTFKSKKGVEIESESVNSIRNVMEKDYQLSLIRFKVK